MFSGACCSIFNGSAWCFVDHFLFFFSWPLCCLTFFDFQLLITLWYLLGRGMITALIWKKACINLFITYFNIELKRTKFTSHTHTHTHTKLWVIDIGWGMITVLIWKRACIVLFIKRLDIMLSEFYPDICPWADIAVALRCLRMGKIDVITYNKYVITVFITLYDSHKNRIKKLVMIRNISIWRYINRMLNDGIISISSVH